MGKIKSHHLRILIYLYINLGVPQLEYNEAEVKVWSCNGITLVAIWYGPEVALEYDRSIDYWVGDRLRCANFTEVGGCMFYVGVPIALCVFLIFSSLAVCS